MGNPVAQHDLGGDGFLAGNWKGAMELGVSKIPNHNRELSSYPQVSISTS